MASPKVPIPVPIGAYSSGGWKKSLFGEWVRANYTVPMIRHLPALLAIALMICCIIEVAQSPRTSRASDR